jgi:hypothetical protein
MRENSPDAPLAGSLGTLPIALPAVPEPGRAPAGLLPYGSAPGVPLLLLPEALPVAPDDVDEAPDESLPALLFGTLPPALPAVPEPGRAPAGLLPYGSDEERVPELPELPELLDEPELCASCMSAGGGAACAVAANSASAEAARIRRGVRCRVVIG